MPIQNSVLASDASLSIWATPPRANRVIDLTGSPRSFAIVACDNSCTTIAKLRGLPVKSITLFALGGVAQIEREASDAKTEFWVGIVGPITSAIIGAVCLARALAFGWDPSGCHQSPAASLLGWLGEISVAL